MLMKRIVLAMLILVLAGCAATPRPGTRSSNRDVLTRAELEGTMQVMAFDAVRQARPNWLRVRGPNSILLESPIMVYVDGVRAGDLSTLESIPVLSVERMRFYDPNEAQGRFGLGHTNGAIEVITRKGP